MKNLSYKQSVFVLTIAGVLPFIVAVIMNWTLVGHSYALVISAFLAGSYWGLSLRGREKAKTKTGLAVLSNVLALSAFATCLWFQQGIGFLLLAVIFCVLFWLDTQLKGKKILEDWYVKIRFYATFVVVLCLTALGIVNF